ncbi:hypothetical protein T492DRAFT_1130242 [Pavlovales sp. CCMP2436]|nr:hypothetical protein T492DRAFT_1130242 [Pavlovales sp. CCMP2436]
MTRTKSAGRKATIASAYTEFTPLEASSTRAYEDYESPPPKTKRQMQLEGLNIGLTNDELKRIGKMSDLQTRPAKSPQDENQISKLIYGNLDTKGGCDAVGIDFGVHNKTIDKLIAMRRTGGIKCQTSTAPLNLGGWEVAIDPYATVTSAVTQLSFSSLETPQNQTRKLTKALKKKLPVTTGNDELAFPFDKTLFTSPLTYVAEASLPISLGCICVLGDTKLLQDEATTDPKASTYTINLILPEEVVSETTYLVTVFRYIPGQTQQRVLTWSSLDTPTVVVAKWKATMSLAVAYAGFTQSFGHCARSFDSASGKYVASFIASADYETFNNGIYYEVDQYSGSNASKINLGLNTSTTLKRFLNSSYGFAEDKSLFNPATQYSLIIADSDLIFDLIFYAGEIEITRNPEGSSSISFYNQIYKPVIRICGGLIVSNAYTGIVCPISRLTVLSNESRALSLTDFLEKRLPTVIGHDSYFSGNIIGRAQNGDPYYVIDSITYLNTELINSKDVVNILSCTATADSWLITTGNKYSQNQIVATPAYNPTCITALNKASAVFLSFNVITSSDDWQVATGWRTSASFVYQGNATSINHNFAFDRNPTTYWASAEAAFSSTSVGSQYDK